LRRRRSGDLPLRVERELDELFLRVLAIGRARREPRRGARRRRGVELHRSGGPGRLVQARRRAGQAVDPAGQPLVHGLGRPNQINQFGDGDQPHAPGPRRPGPGPPGRVRRPAGAGSAGARDAVGPRPGGVVGRPGARILGRPARPHSCTPRPRRLAGPSNGRGGTSDAYGVDPREARIDRAESRASTCARSRCSTPEGSGPGGSGRAWCSPAWSDGMTAAERDAVVELAGHTVASSRAPHHPLAGPSSAGDSDDAPLEADSRRAGRCAPGPGRRCSGRRVRRRCHRRAGRTGLSRDSGVRPGSGGRPLHPMKVVFVTPRYGPRSWGAPSRRPGCWPSTWQQSPGSRWPLLHLRARRPGLGERPGTRGDRHERGHPSPASRWRESARRSSSGSTASCAVHHAMSPGTSPRTGSTSTGPTCPSSSTLSDTASPTSPVFSPYPKGRTEGPGVHRYRSSP